MLSTLFAHLRQQWMGALALFLVLTGGVAYAADTVFSSDIVDGEVKAEDIATAAVRTQELGTNQIRSADVRDDTLAGGGLSGADIALDTLTSEDIAENTVHTNDILNATVLDKDLADGSVRSPEVLDDSLTGADIAADAVGPTEIADNSVTPAKLAVAATFINAPIFTNFDLPITCDGRPPEWYNVGSNSHNAVGFYRDPSGIVHLRGLALNCAAFGTPIFNLPAGYRPARSEHLVGLLDLQGGVVAVRVAPSGDVIAPVANTALVSLDGLTFRCGPAGQDTCP